MGVSKTSELIRRRFGKGESSETAPVQPSGVSEGVGRASNDSLFGAGSDVEAWEILGATRRQPSQGTESAMLVFLRDISVAVKLSSIARN